MKSAKASSTKPPKASGLQDLSKVGGSQLNISACQQKASDPKASTESLAIGDRVVVGGSKRGVVAYIGTTQFAAGDWVGVELDTPAGKNDGSVGGVRYFTCTPLHGVFARAEKLSKLGSESDSTTFSALDVEELGTVTSVECEQVALALDSSTSAGMDKVDCDAEITSPSVSENSLLSSADTFMPVESVMGPPPVPPAVDSAGGDKSSSIGKNGQIGSERPGTSAAGVSVLKKSTALPSAKGSGLIPRPAFGSTVSLSRQSVSNSTVDLNASSVSEAMVKHNLKIGDRVSMGGNKIGTLRFLGPTEFAKGEWAGVELDEPIGKNDGSVTGRRLRRGSGSVSRIPIGPSLALSRERSGSQESLSSIGSMASTASRPRLRLGITSLAGQTPKSRHGGGDTTPSASSSATSALHKALKEKEEHVEQLLLERDLDRSEVAKTAIQYEEVESQLTMLTGKYNRLLSESEDGMKKMKALIDKLESEKNGLANQLEEERKKVDDLQFAVEETSIDKGDLETQTERDSRKLKELESQLRHESSSVQCLVDELAQLKISREEDTNKMKILEEQANRYSKQVEDLTMKLSDESDRSTFLESERACHIEVEQLEMKNELEEQAERYDSLIKELNLKLTEAAAKVKHIEMEYQKQLEVAEQNSGSRVQELVMANSEMKEKLVATEKQLNDVNVDREKLLERFSELEKSFNEVTEQLSSLSENTDGKVADLIKQLLSEKQQFQELKGEQKAIEEALKEREKQILNTNEKLAELDRSKAAETELLAVEKSKVVSMEEELKNLSRKLEQCVASEQSCASAAEEQRARVSDLENANKMLSSELEQAKAYLPKVSELEEQLAVVNGREKSLTDELHAIRDRELKLVEKVDCEYSRAAEAETKNRELTGDVEVMKMAKIELEKALERESAKLTEKDALLSKLHADIAYLKEASMKEMNQELSVQLEKIKTMEEEHTKALACEQAKLVEIERQHAEEVKELEKFSNELETTGLKVTQLEAKLVNVTADLTTSKALEQELTEKLETDHRKCTELEQLIESQKLELSECNKEIECLNDRLQKEAEQKNIDANKRISLNAALEAEKNHAAVLVSQNEVLIGDLKLLKSAEEELKKSVELYQMKISKLDAAHSELVASVGKLTAERDALSREAETNDSRIGELNNLNQELMGKLKELESREGELQKLRNLSVSQLEDSERVNRELTTKLEAVKGSESDQTKIIEDQQLKLSELERQYQTLSEQLLNAQKATEDDNRNLIELSKVNSDLMAKSELIAASQATIIEELKAKINESSESILELNKNLEQAKSSEFEMCSLLETEKKDTSDLRRVNEELLLKLDSLKTTEVALRQSVDEYCKQIVALNELNTTSAASHKQLEADLENVMIQKDTRIRELESSNQDLLERINEMKSTVNDLQKTKDVESARCVESERINRELVTKLEAVKGSENDQTKIIEAQQTNISDLERQCLKLSELLQDAQRTVDDSKEKFSNLEKVSSESIAKYDLMVRSQASLIEELQVKITDSSKSIVELNVNLEQARNAATEVSSQLEIEKENVSDSNHANQKLLSELEIIKLAEAELKQSVEIHRKKIVELDEVGTESKASIEQLTTELASVTAERDAKINELDRSNLDFAERLNEMKSAISDLQKSKDLETVRCEEFERANRELATKLEALKGNENDQVQIIVAEQAKVCELDRQCHKLSEQLQEASEAIDKEKLRVASLEQANCELTATIEQMSTDKHNIVEEHHAKINELDKVSQDFEQKLASTSAKLLEVERALETEREECVKLKDIHENMVQKLGANEEEKHNLSKEIALEKQNFIEVEQKNHLLCADMESLKVKMNRVEEECKAKIVELERKNSDLGENSQTAVSEQRRIVEECEMKIAALEQMNMQLTAETKALESAEAELKMKSDTASAMCDEYIDLNKQLHVELEHTKSTLVEQMSLVVLEKEKNSKLEENSKELIAEVEQLKAMEQMLADSKKRIAELERGNAELSTHISSMSNDISSTKEQELARVTELNRVIDDLNKKLAILSGAESDVKNMLEIESVKCSRLEQLNGELSRKLDETLANKLKQETLLECKVSEVEQRNTALLEEIQQLKDSQLKDVSVVHEQMQTKLTEAKQCSQILTGEVERVKLDKERLEQEAEILNTKVNALTQTIEQLREELTKANEIKREGLNAQSKEHAELLDLVKSKTDKLEERNLELIADCQRLADVEQELLKNLQAERSKAVALETVSEELERIKAVEGELQKQLSSERSRVSELEELNKRLTSEQKQSSQVDEENAKLVSRIEDLEQRLKDSDIAVQDTKKSMLSAADVSKNELSRKDSSIEQLKDEVARLAAESRTVQSLQQENSLLKNQVSQFEKRTHDSNANGLHTEDDDDSVQAQIDFLNSVIVDLQRKNQTLQAQLEAYVSGQMIDSSVADKSETSPAPRAIAPRLFCDICDMFDLHDTDDCPRQAMSSSPPLESHHHGDRNAVRPYCDTCEVFGHWTADCEDDQTY